MSIDKGKRDGLAKQERVETMQTLIDILAGAARKLHMYYGITEVAVFDTFVIDNIRVIRSHSHENETTVLADISLQLTPVILWQDVTTTTRRAV